MKKLQCKDLGFECGYEVEAETEQEILAAVARHAGEKHGIDPVPPEVVEAARAAIQDVATAG